MRNRSAGNCTDTRVQHIPAKAYLSETLLQRIHRLACLEPDEPIYGILLGHFEEKPHGDLLSITSSVLLCSNGNICSAPLFSEDAFLEAFESNQMKVGNRQVLGWFAARKTGLFPLAVDITTHEKYFRRPNQVELILDLKRERFRMYRFLGRTPFAIPLRTFRESDSTGTMVFSDRTNSRIPGSDGDGRDTISAFEHAWCRRTRMKKTGFASKKKKPLVA